MARVTLPIEKGYEKLVLKLIKRWQADAIRNSDGTKLNEYFENLNLKIYSTYFGTREDQEWAKNNPLEKQNIALTVKKLATDEILKINLLAPFYKEQFSINEEKKALKYMQVINVTTNKELKKSDFKYEKGVVTINKPIKFNEYRVNFFAYQDWDVTHMYNTLTNNWNVDKSIPYDPINEKTKKHILKNINDWCVKNKKVDIVRFTTFFYHFTVIYDNLARQMFGDWFGYSASCSPQMLDLFFSKKGYRITLEDIVDKGYYNNQFRIYSEKFLDYLDFVQQFVSKAAKECVDVVHKYNKKAYMFIGDNWIGTEPYGNYFKTIGLDGVVGSAECGVDIRMVSDLEGIKTKEIRFLPYLFPDTFKEGAKPHLEWEYNWYRSRRAILAKKVDRIGFGGYLSLTKKFHKYISSVEKAVKEFNEIHNFTKKEESKKPKYKIGILNAWGKIKSWQANRTGHASGNIENKSYIGILEILSGLPYNVEFINFEDVKNKEKLSEFKIILNVGLENTSFSGGHLWLQEKVIKNIREFVYEGNIFIGIGDPSYVDEKGYLLSDILGVNKEIGNTLQYSKYFNEVQKIKSLYDTIEPYLNTGLDKKYIYQVSDSLQIQQLDDQFGIEFSINNYGKGYGVYLQGLEYSIDNTRLIHNLIRYLTKEKTKYIPDNQYVEVYEFKNILAIVNNCNKKLEVNITSLGTIKLNEYELLWKKK